MLKKLINKYFDYDIVGCYIDYDGKGHGKKKYIKRWRLRQQYKLFKKGARKWLK